MKKQGLACMFVVILILSSIQDSRAQIQSKAQPKKGEEKRAPYLLPPLTGGEYVEKSPKVKGHPFILQTNFHSGSFQSNGKTYRNIFLNYDIQQDVLLSFHSILQKRMELNHRKIDYFSLGENLVFVLKKDSNNQGWNKNGIYQLLWQNSGKELLAKHSKTVNFNSHSSKKSNAMQHLTIYFLYENGEFNRIRWKNDFIRLLGMRPKSVKKHLKQQGLKFNKNKAKYLQGIANYYDTQNGL